MLKSLFCEEISAEYEFKSEKFKGSIDLRGEENRHKVVFRQKSIRVTGLYLKKLFTSPLKVKGYAIIE